LCGGTQLLLPVGDAGELAAFDLDLAVLDALPKKSAEELGVVVVFAVFLLESFVRTNHISS
jgi:hypothetical protein